MMKLTTFFIALMLCGMANAQAFITRNGFIGFYSKTPLEDIKAENNQVYAVIDVPTQRLAFTLLVKGFMFKKGLMQQHFNENYVESDKYPKASFSGTFSPGIDAAKNGAYKVTVTGNLTLHGVTQKMEVPATIEVKDNKLFGTANFTLLPADYNITIPTLVRDKIAKTIDVKVAVECIKR